MLNIIRTQSPQSSTEVVTACIGAFTLRVYAEISQSNPMPFNAIDSECINNFYCFVLCNRWNLSCAIVPKLFLSILAY